MLTQIPIQSIESVPRELMEVTRDGDVAEYDVEFKITFTWDYFKGKRDVEDLTVESETSLALETRRGRGLHLFLKQESGLTLSVSTTMKKKGTAVAVVSRLFRNVTTLLKPQKEGT